MKKDQRKKKKRKQKKETKKGTMFRRRHRVKCSVKVTIVSASGLSGEQVASVRWQRGDKDDNTGETTRKTSFDGRVTWNESANIMCTFFRSGDEYKAKMISFTLRHYRGEKGYVLGRATLDLSRFIPPAGSSTPTTNNEMLVVRNTTKNKVSTLNVTIVTTYLGASAMGSEEPSETSTAAGFDDEFEKEGNPFVDKDETPKEEGGGGGGDKEKEKEREREREKEKERDKEKEKEKEKDEKAKKKKFYPRKGSLAASENQIASLTPMDANGNSCGGVSSDLITSILQASLSREFVPPGMPKSAQIIMSNLASSKALSNPALILQQFKSVLGICKYSHGWDYISVMGWVSCAVWLIKECPPRITGKSIREPIRVTDESTAKSLSLGNPIVLELQLFLRDMFMTALERGFQSLRVSVQLLTDIPGINTNSKRSFGFKDPLKRTEFMNVQPGLVQMYRSQKLTAVSVLEEAQNAMSEAQVPMEIRVQYIIQMCHFINASVMNLVLSGPELSTPQAALQIKFEMSLIEGWLSKEPKYLIASSRLAQTKDWANLVVMGKDILLDDALVKSTFPTLTWKQIYKTLVNISDVEDTGKGSVEKVSPEVIRKVLTYSQANQNQKIAGQNDDPYYIFYDIL